MERAEYHRIHRWLNYHGTKAGVCSKCGHEGRTEWALKEGAEHARDLSRYDELCHGCNMRRDRLSWIRNPERREQLRSMRT